MKAFRIILYVLLFVCFLWIFIPSAESEISNEHADHKQTNNIILLMGDDHGWEETAYNGHPFIKTPVLDDMAKRGLVLNRLK